MAKNQILKTVFKQSYESSPSCVYNNMYLREIYSSCKNNIEKEQKLYLENPQIW